MKTHNDEMIFLSDIIELIEKVFPSLTVWLEKVPETSEYFVLINNGEIYHSDSFQELVETVGKVSVI